MSALVKARDESTTGLDLWMAMSNICFTAWIKDHNHHALCTVAHPLVAHCACSWDLASPAAPAGSRSAPCCSLWQACAHVRRSTSRYKVLKSLKVLNVTKCYVHTDYSESPRPLHLKGVGRSRCCTYAAAGAADVVWKRGFAVRSAGRLRLKASVSGYS